MRLGRLEQRPAGRQLVEGRAQAVNVGAAVDRLLERRRLLGAHVPRRAHQRAVNGQRRLVHPLGQAKIGQPHDAVTVEQQVRRLDVAVDHPALVGMRQRLGGLKAPRGNVVARERLARSLRFSQNVGQASARDILHGVIVHAVLAADGEDRHDVGVVQPRDRLGLALKALHRFFDRPRRQIAAP